MSMEAPPSLQELARQSLLRNLASPSPPLEDLPEHLFIPMFKEAFERSHTETLRAMVQAWPFTCLPLGSLMKQVWPYTCLPLGSLMERVPHFTCFTLGPVIKRPYLCTIEALLDGLDMLLTQKVRPRCKLQVLDLRDMHGDFWSRGSRALPGAHSAEAVWEEQRARHAPRSAPKQPLTILLDIDVLTISMDGFYARFLTWVEERQAVLHVCCERLKISLGSMCDVGKVLDLVPLDCIRELEMDSFWTEDSMEALAPYVSKMRGLHTFRFTLLGSMFHDSSTQNRWHSQNYAIHFRKLRILPELSIHYNFFLSGQLHEILRSLTPLKTLSLRSSPLRESDMEHLSQCPCTSQLKHLDLRDISMEGFSPEPLRVLLERVVSTLETLVLERCGLTDAQLQVLLPALSRCSQLRTLSCCGNRISMAVLEDLLRHTARLRHLRRGLYPVPWESSEHPKELSPCCVYEVKFTKVLQGDLRQVLRDIRPPHEVQFCTCFCNLCHWCKFYFMDPSGIWEFTKMYRF